MRLRQRSRAVQHISSSTATTATVERIVDPAMNLDAVWEAEWQKNIFEAALANVKRQVSPRQYQIFDLYTLQKWPISKVAQTLGVSVGQVYLAKHRVSGLVKKEVKTLQQQLV